jgi:hypothetical protein
VVLFFMELSTRKVEIAGIAPVAKGLWMTQIGYCVCARPAGLPSCGHCLVVATSDIKPVGDSNSPAANIAIVNSRPRVLKRR